MTYWEDAYGIVNINNYQQAAEHWDNALPVRGSDLRHGAKKRSSNKRLRRHADGSIGYVYYGHEFACYHPNGDVTVHTESRNRWGWFPNSSLPDEINNFIGTRTGPLARLAMWWKDNGRNREPMIIRADQPVRLKKVGNDWTPVEPDKLKEFQWFEVDRKTSRALAKDAGLTDFQSWLNAYMTLKDGELPASVPGYMADEPLLEALAKQDYPTVLDHLPRTTTYHWNPTTSNYEYGSRVSASYLTFLRTKIYLERGGVKLCSAKILSAEQYRRVENHLRRFGRPKSWIK